jgi:hypothetical protein
VSRVADMFGVSVLVASMSACGIAGLKAHRVLGAENRCTAAVEVSVSDEPSVEQPTRPWVLIDTDSWATLGEVTARKLSVFVRAPGAETGTVYSVDTNSLVRTSGKVDLFFEVENEFCP